MNKPAPPLSEPSTVPPAKPTLLRACIGAGVAAAAAAATTLIDVVEEEEEEVTCWTVGAAALLPMLYDVDSVREVMCRVVLLVRGGGRA